MAKLERISKYSYDIWGNSKTCDMCGYVKATSTYKIGTNKHDWCKECRLKIEQILKEISQP